MTSVIRPSVASSLIFSLENVKDIKDISKDLSQHGSLQMCFRYVALEAHQNLMFGSLFSTAPWRRWVHVVVPTGNGSVPLLVVLCGKKW